jgi:hypothetical protein
MLMFWVGCGRRGVLGSIEKKVFRVFNGCSQELNPMQEIFGRKNPIKSLGNIREKDEVGG